ncbi:hypothetical protein B9Z55_009196 [Caenorhabditis nigoni]|uniref:BTB domain-containing protein n=1 Tax=Caenorhabditis nigoni TaxID=1611254 RepID=A0A2G5UQY5_9PELO|nr:hypothetical protein B9Z55_009196 [Caenorhabditis nigoni]
MKIQNFSNKLLKMENHIVFKIYSTFKEHAQISKQQTKVISHKSDQKVVTGITSVLETGEKDGIKHTWSGQVDTSQKASFIWKFDWEELKKQGCNRLVGHLIVTSCFASWNPQRVDINWTDTKHAVSVTVESGGFSSYTVLFEYKLTAHSAESHKPEKLFPPPEKISFDEIFVASDKTDVVLVVEGKKLNVNKTFLSIHSDYFSSLFSANFIEGQMKEIEIKEVSYEDFGLLLSSFHSNPHFPNDHTVEKLLEMANRFQVLSVIGIVEYHLLHISKIGYEKMLWLADEYMMPKLLERCIRQMDSFEKAGKLKMSPECEKLSDRTNSLIFKRLLEII